MPRWVKVFIVVGIVLVLGFVISHLAGVRHGPSMHTPADEPAEHSPPTGHGP